MDYFTKWPDAYPFSDQEASTVAEVLVKYWISRFGVPLQLYSDQRRNLDCAVCKRLCELLAIVKARTTALHPQSDGMVERSSVQPATRGTLATRGVYREIPGARMEEMHHLARERIGMASEKMKTRYDARATGHDFHDGDKVWLWNPKRRKGHSKAVDQLGRSLHSPKKTE
ncbi:transposon Ty3-G Gag-Pol polyprotein [Trichonephila clavipes]|nr:transposon Ty3-G Gag-Pol polyprotein [Trichonephila clavipes]